MGQVTQNIRVLLKQTATDGPVRLSNFTIDTDTPVPTESGLQVDQVLLEAKYLSADSYMQHRVKKTKNSYLAPFEENHCIESYGGETLVVSAVSGTVGQTVIELAKAYGLKFLSKGQGVDKVFNYRTIDSYEDTLKRLCPNGIDVYFDNVGGECLDGVLVNINTHARIIICGGLASQYEPDKANH
ncbi:hypothetical protein H4R35_001243 [Dimargaris xerosporica]|nr:hypothetical protein H4R35_001243 [Dimargaris xerosporica]